jgi:nitronate monooxygenase
MNFGSGGNQKSKAWKDIWGCGQGIGAVGERMSTAAFVDQLASEYDEAVAQLTKGRAFASAG